MKKSFVALAIVAACVAFVLYRTQGSRSETIVVKLTPGPLQPKVSPAEAGIDLVGIQAAVDYAGERNTRALVVGRGGHIVFEKYWDDSTLETQVLPEEFEPVLTAILVGSLMNDRLIMNLDAPASQYLPELEGTPAGAGTLRDHLAGHIEETPAGSMNVLKGVLEKAARQPYETTLSERLWRPLGAGEFSLKRTERSGANATAVKICCVQARIADWMRVGGLLANDGVFDGNQFTPPRYVTLMRTPTHKHSPVGFGVNVDGSFAAKDVAWLRSAGTQRMWVVPSLQLVILRIGGDPPKSKGWDEAMIPDSIIRGTSGWRPASAGEGMDPNKFAPH